MTGHGYLGNIDPAFPGNSLCDQILSDLNLQKIYFLITVEKPQFLIRLISSCADQFNSCALLKSKIACLHVSFTTYEYFYKLSKSASLSRWLLHPVTQKNQ